jgi:flagellar FliJ protein
MFRFKLEALLNHRRHQEEDCQKKLAEAHRKLSDERKTLLQIKTKKQKSLEILQARKKISTTVTDIRLYVNYIQQLSMDIEYQARHVQKSAKIVDQKRHDLIAIMKKRKTLQKLKSKEKLTYQRTLMQDERKLMDELASIRFARKK